MGLMTEYINRKMSSVDLEKELLGLIKKYNDKRNTFLFVYCAALNKPIPMIALDQDDYYIFRDMLNKAGSKNVDIYIETPGGSGEAAEEIVRYLRKKFENVAFVVSGEAKSAGTIIVLSGDEILMTETGSLGPIDAQLKIGRSTISAYDYTEWVQDKRTEAAKTGSLNPFDAVMIAQITPGELGGTLHSLEFAKDLVIEWLTKYKFKNWNLTETKRLPVTLEMKKKRASEIADELAKHSKWRSHGRSIKIENLEEIGLKVTRVDSDPILADITYRIHVVCRLLFGSTNIYKIFATAENKIFKNATPAGPQIQFPIPMAPGPPLPGGPVPLPGMPPGVFPPPLNIQQAEIVEINQKCPQCGALHPLYAKLSDRPEVDTEMQRKGLRPFPPDSKLACACGFQIDLLGLRNKIEIDTGKKIII